MTTNKKKAPKTPAPKPETDFDKQLRELCEKYQKLGHDQGLSEIYNTLARIEDKVDALIRSAIQ